jgi:pimeloyl-ACP methyl ester carboxylesterase
VHKRYADTRFGQIHYVEEGTGHPVLLLHQTPRSWDEYRDVIPLLSTTHRVIAPDTLGFGSSDSPAEPWTVELFAAGVVDLVDSLGLDSFSLVGHHTGGVIAIEVAASLPERVADLVLSATPYVGPERRELVATTREPVDAVPLSDDGSHYKLLWDRRTSFYPSDRPDLLRRLMVDAVRVGERVEDGHLAVNAYRMEDRVGFVRARTLILCGELDPFSLPDLPRLLERIVAATSVVLPGVGVPAVDHDPEGFAAEVSRFLARVPVSNESLEEASR